SEATSVLFEAPDRVGATLADLVVACGPGRPVAMARELTKVHEEIWRGPLGAGATWASEHPLRGEVVLVVEGTGDVHHEVSDATLVEAIDRRLASGDRLRGVAEDIAAVYEVPRRRVYELALDRAGRRTVEGAEGLDPEPVPE
ncbi:MAG: hypothetical protein JO368_03925, partial [Acidimicrobiales bacterium]|nr:hypothetical protein [Acidimicrobiales bacterium]